VGKRVDGVVVERRVYGRSLEVLADLDASGAVAARYVFLNPLGAAAYMVKDGQAYRILSDHLGSARLVINADTGAVAQRIDYDAWGEILQDTSPGFQPFAFTGREYDAEPGLYYYRARYYDPEVGRFTSEDPIGFAGGGNPFAYARNRPMDLIDPFGLSSLTYYPETNQIYVQSGSGDTLGTYPAYNNTASNSGGPWDPGTYDFSWWSPHAGDGPNDPYGSHGNFIFDVSPRQGMGVHSGRESTCTTSPPVRCGAEYPTMGCIRTTDEATELIKDTHQGGDPVTEITVMEMGIRPLGPTTNATSRVFP
jgi:RHS repeat-associated protein